MILKTAFAALLLSSVPLLAQEAVQAQGAIEVTGDAQNGEIEFRQCVQCHLVQDDEGTILAGRGGSIGPNLYEVAGATAGQVAGYRYSKLLTGAGEQAVIYDEEFFVAFLTHPTNALRERSGLRGSSSMSYRVRDAQDARDIFAYLASLAPNPAETGEADGDIEQDKSDAAPSGDQIAQ